MKFKINTIPSEFKTFILRGNVMDLAVGIIIGAAFTSIVNSLVKDIIMPPIGLLLKGVDFSNLYINLSRQSFSTFAEAQAAGVPTINYGVFINNLITFLITAIAVFFLVRAVNHLQLGVKKKNEAESALEKNETERGCPFCYEIIDKRATRCAHCTADLSASRL